MNCGIKGSSVRGIQILKEVPKDDNARGKILTMSVCVQEIGDKWDSIFNIKFSCYFVFF